MLVSQIITHVPLWVWLILVFVVFRGVKAMQTRIVPMRKLIIMPILMLYISIDNIHNFPGFAIGAVIGVIVGYILFSRIEMRVDRSHRLVEVQGSVTTLILVLTTFIVKFGLGIYMAMHTVVPNSSTGMTTAAIIGIFGGLYISRLIIFYINYVKAPSVSLK
ncbi:MAG: hypothetical protein NTX05_02600 [Fusobacteria bacterium]|nr:hypothetical protein [Fusobacteriota bacterium]